MTGNLLGSRPALHTSKYFSPPPPPRSVEQSWPHAAPCSRFSISPASIASFSLTHLTDSDMEQGGELGGLRAGGLGGLARWAQRPRALMLSWGLLTGSQDSSRSPPGLGSALPGHVLPFSARHSTGSVLHALVPSLPP